MLSYLAKQPDMACLLAKVEPSVSKGITVITKNTLYMYCLFYKQKELYTFIFRVIIQ